MGVEINLMKDYPRTNRDVSGRLEKKTEAEQNLARKFGKEFFDGERSHGYGGFNYHPRFWQPVIPTFQEHWQLKPGDSVLDVGCAKGFMLWDFLQLIPGLKVAGLDISKYAVEHAIPEVKNYCQVGCATDLPFESNSIDVVLSITTLHNLEGNELIEALKEIERVSKRGSFITVDAYRNDEEKKRMHAWNLTAKTMLHVDEWQELFNKAGYTGDFYWFIP